MAQSGQGIAIFAPLIIALPTTLGTIVIHGVAVIAIVHFVRHQRRLGCAGIRFWRDVLIVSGATLLVLMAHLVEIVIWALVFALCGEFTHLAPAVYHSCLTLANSDVSVPLRSSKLFRLQRLRCIAITASSVVHTACARYA